MTTYAAGGVCRQTEPLRRPAVQYITFVRRTKFPPNETAGGRNDDYIGLTSESNQSACARPVTGSLCPGPVYGLHSLDCLESGTLLPNCNYRQTVVYIAPDYCCSDHKWYIESYTVRSSITVILIVWYCIGVFRLQAMASDDWADGDESGPSYAPSGPLPGTFLGPALDIRSDSLYELAPELQDVMGLRAVRPDAAVAKVMSVCNSRCIRVVTPDDHVTCGYHEILLHDLGDYTASEPCNHSCRRRSLPPNTAVTEVGGLVHKHITFFRRTNFPPNRVVAEVSDSVYKYRKFFCRPDPTPVVCAAGRNGKEQHRDCAVSMQRTSDWVTSSRIVP